MKWYQTRILFEVFRIIFAVSLTIIFTMYYVDVRPFAAFIIFFPIAIISAGIGIAIPLGVHLFEKEHPGFKQVYKDLTGKEFSFFLE